MKKLLKKIKKNLIILIELDDNPSQDLMRLVSSIDDELTKINNYERFINDSCPYYTKYGESEKRNAFFNGSNYAKNYFLN